MIRVDRRLIIGTSSQLERALFNSEDWSTLNTSFIERHNLTLRQGSAYTPSHARRLRPLEEQLALLMTYNHFVQPHGALKFGKEVRTPAMQAGLAQRLLSFRDIFMSRVLSFWCFVYSCLRILGIGLSEEQSSARMSLAAVQQQFPGQAPKSMTGFPGRFS